MSLYFLFNGKSSKNILNTELILCHMEDSYSSTAPIYNTELITTSLTSQRNTKDYIGSKFITDGLNLKFALIKSNYTPFSIDEIDIISNWLYDSKGGFKKLEVTSNENEDAFWNENINEWVSKFYYKGKFIIMDGQRIIGTRALICTFERDSSFLYSLECGTDIIAKGMNRLIVLDNVKCQLPLYPKIIFTTSSASTEFNSVTITNKTNGSKMYLPKILDGIDYIIDTENSLVQNAYGSSDLLDIGWSQVSDISWIYLDKGENDIQIDVKNGECNIKIEYENKILGGVMDEFSV